MQFLEAKPFPFLIYSPFYIVFNIIKKLIVEILQQPRKYHSSISDIKFGTNTFQYLKTIKLDNSHCEYAKLKLGRHENYVNCNVIFYADTYS